MSTVSGLDPQAAPEGHDEKMAAAFDAQVTPPAAAAPAPEATPERPSWLPEKFKSPEDLAKAYDELSKKLGTAPKEPEVPAKPAEAPKDPLAIEGGADDAAAKDAVAAAGLDFDALATEFTDKGALSEASYEALTKAGIPKEYVDSYIDGQLARADAVRFQVLAEVGGEDNFVAMSQWAARNVAKADLAAYNAAVDSGDVAQKKLAVRGLYARYTEANGVAPALVGGQSKATAGDVFRSTNELTAAMSDPRYGSDPAYTQDVISKLDRSDIL